MRRILVVVVMGLIMSTAAADKQEQERRLGNAATVLGEVAVPDAGAPLVELLQKESPKNLSK